MTSQSDKFPKEPAEGDREVITTSLRANNQSRSKVKQLGLTRSKITSLKAFAVSSLP
jgi:hypothetical protein